jgi:predicted dehydrogenase
LPQSAERRQFFESFADAVLEGRKPPVTAGEARHVQAIIEAAYLSSEQGQTVRVSERPVPLATE